MLIIMILMVILLIQAYSDYKTRQVYYWLSIAGIAAGIVPCAKALQTRELPYMGMILLLIFLQYITRAFTAGDAKLCLMVLEILTVYTEKMRVTETDILIIYLIFTAVSLLYFLLFVMVRKIRDRGTVGAMEKRYAYAPAVFASVCSLFLFGILT